LKELRRQLTSVQVGLGCCRALLVMLCCIGCAGRGMLVGCMWRQLNSMQMGGAQLRCHAVSKSCTAGL
jgi:hypothetical protein